MIDDFDIVALRKDDSSNFVFSGIVLIIIGFLTAAFFIGILLIPMGILLLFYKEYFVILVNEKGDIPLIKGNKHKMQKIVKRIKQAKELR
ncbi:MAG: hypothetical protein B7Z06_05705 [Flavobacteriales bacterium 32-35-8]|nr:MAG: hypothetical protein B7Z06_05705 [Flavobacteriales bacterium 32-35-8]